MTLNGVMTADPYYLCGIVAEFLDNLENVARIEDATNIVNTPRETDKADRQQIALKYRVNYIKKGHLYRV